MPKEMTAGDLRRHHTGKKILVYNARGEGYTTGILAAYKHEKQVPVAYSKKFWQYGREDLTYFIIQGRFEPYCVLSSLRVLLLDKEIGNA